MLSMTSDMYLCKVLATPPLIGRHDERVEALRVLWQLEDTDAVKQRVITNLRNLGARIDKMPFSKVCQGQSKTSVLPSDS